jgi:hypothetical protein
MFLRRFNSLIKGVAVFLLLLVFALMSCDNNRGTGSASSAGGGSGTGTDQKITINIVDRYIPFNGTTGVTAVVRDSAGAPIPYGTMVCFTAINNCFLDGEKCYATICKSTTNNLGWSSQTYYAKYAIGRDTIQVYGPDAVAGDEIIVYETE